MNISKFFITFAVITTLTMSPVLAAESTSAADSLPQTAEFKQHNKEDFKQKREEYRKDPIKGLESKKTEIQSNLKDGKISKEEAEREIKKIDSKIKEIQDFNKLTLQQKKDNLINDCKFSIEKLVKEGKIDRNKADEIIKDYSEKLSKWDGNGYPKFRMRRHKESDNKE